MASEAGSCIEQYPQPALQLLFTSALRKPSQFCPAELHGQPSAAGRRRRNPSSRCHTPTTRRPRNRSGTAACCTPTCVDRVQATALVLPNERTKSSYWYVKFSEMFALLRLCFSTLCPIFSQFALKASPTSE